MGKIIYSNIFAFSIHYPVIDYILNIKEMYEKDDLLILCFWDYEIYNFKKSQTNLLTDNLKIKEITKELSKLLNSLNIEHKIIYMSDAIKRVNNDEELFNLLFSCYTNITMGSIQDTYSNNEYLKLRPTTLSKINFMVIDYLIAIFFQRLYPNISKNKPISIYHTGERFLGIKDSVENTISKNELIISFPSIKYWKAIPILNYLKGDWISTSTSKTEIETNIRESNIYKNKNLIIDLIKIGYKLNNENLNEKIDNFLKKIDTYEDKDLIIQEVTNILYQYFYNVKKLIENSTENEIKKVTYINTKDQLNKILDNINPAKMEILKLCNGKNTIEDIINSINMKESSVRSYISRMKKEKLISDSKKPIRLIDEIIINFE